MNLFDLEKELIFQTSRSGGKGGQHVNKVETRVELYFDLKNSKFLTNNEKQRLLEKLNNRINKEGVLKLSVEKERSQTRNKKLAIALFADLITTSLVKEKVRISTTPSKNKNEKRLKEKKIVSEKKQRRKNL